MRNAVTERPAKPATIRPSSNADGAYLLETRDGSAALSGKQYARMAWVFEGIVRSTREIPVNVAIVTNLFVLACRWTKQPTAMIWNKGQ
jgi:hypothetical protein